MKVIDLTTKAQDLHVRLDPSPVYDFLAAMFVVENWTSDRGFDVGRQWVQRARALVRPTVRKDLRLFMRERSFVMGLVSTLEQQPGLSVRDFIKALAALPPAELVERMLTAPRAARPIAALLREAARTRSPRAINAFVAAYPDEFEANRLRVLVTEDASRVQVRLIGLLRGFYGKVYRQEEASLLPVLRADVQAKEALARVLPAGELVERATGGYTVTPEGEVAQVVLAPSYFSRPYNLISEYPGVRVFVYPVEPGNGEAGSSTRDLVRLFKALGDETRVRILQMLAEREMYLQEVANRLGVTHVTAMHHLALLRAAQLVRVVERGNLKYYQLRPEMAAEAGRRATALVAR